MPQVTETKAQFSRRMGVSKPRVSQWVKAGLPLNADGHVKIDAALKWLRNRIPEVGRFTDRGIHKLATEAAGGDNPAPEPEAPEPAQRPAADAGAAYIKSRAAKMAEDARRSKTDATRAALELRARQGELVHVGDVQVAAFNRARIVRDGMLNIPDRVAPMLAAESDEGKVHAMLSAEIRTALVELAGGLGDDGAGG